MKKILKRILSAFMVATIFIVGMVVPVFATQSMAGNYSRNFSLTGNGADDIVAVALAQLGRSNLGYTEAWCADFVSDCARIAGVESLIPFNGGVVYLRNAILNAGGSVVSSRQKGDIVFYYCSYCGVYPHVGIVLDGTYSIEGNVNSQVYKVGGSNGNYMDANGHSLNSGITREYIRPRYMTHTCSYSSSVTKAATCNATGIRTYTCSCGNSYTESIAKNASNHAGGTVIKNAVEATVEKEGYTGDTYCKGCNVLISRGTTVPKIDEKQWVYVTSLPSHVTSDKYDIEYNNVFEKTATTSPGSGWTKGALQKTAYENNGGTYESDFELSTSNTRVLVSYYYYHWCGSSTGNLINFAYNDAHNHYDAYYETNAVYEEKTISDWDDPRYTAYYLAWVHKPGEHCYCSPSLTCDSSNSHPTRSCWWYKRYVYQDKTEVKYYKFTKESGWTDKKDNTATTVEIRYKLKDHECSYTSSVTKTATCTVAGIRTFSCLCGKTYTESIHVLGHSYKSTVTPPTCTEEGYTKHICSRCGNSYTDGKTPATDHDLAISIKPPTCSEEGKVTYTCDCGYEYSADVPKSRHVEGDWENGENGKLVKKCFVCGTVLESKYAEITVLNLGAAVETVTINKYAGLMLSTKVSEEYEDANIVWESSDPSVVTVDSKGNIFGAGIGTAEITATIEGTDLSDTVTVNVKYSWWQWIIVILLFGWLWF